MKTALLTIFLFLLIVQLKAQQISLVAEPVAKPSEAALNWENQKLRSDLTLDEAQTEKIKSITAERAQARSIVKEMFKLEPKKLEAKLREIDSQFDGEFEAIMNAKQLKKFLKIEGRDKAKVAAAEAQADEPNFNARIQDMISKARMPVIDPSLMPYQDSLASSNAESDSLQQIIPAGLEPKPVLVAPSQLAASEAEQPAATEKPDDKLIIPEKLELPATNIHNEADKTNETLKEKNAASEPEKETLIGLPEN